MTKTALLNSAEQAAKEALDRVYDCIDNRKCFVLEAGAGAGKTYSLISALRYLIDKQGTGLLRQNQQVACITYTNVARDEIESRTDRHPAIYSSTIHAFCWSLIKDFQSVLREELPQVGKWSERLEESGGIGLRAVVYDLGYPSVQERHVSLHHDDVLALTVRLLERPRFRTIFADRYPILFIDEYQDTDRGFAEALQTHFLDTGEGPLIGFFGDHWQKIYGTGCGRIKHRALQEINKNSNFRSVGAVVDVLNHMRRELIQNVKDPDDEGSAVVYHTNLWAGSRRTEGHWKGDLPSAVAHDHLDALKKQLASEGWNFSPEKSKILMLTHNVLAEEQGYQTLAGVFSRNEAFVKKEDEHIAFFVDTLEPVCTAYEARRFGDMFEALGGGAPAIRSHVDKLGWAQDMAELLALRATKTIGEVMDHLRRTGRLRLPEAVERRERGLERLSDSPTAEEPSSIERLRKLRDVPYQEVISLARFINGHTPFSTQHGVKGAEFENVLVVVGRGWNLYNFNQMLEWAGSAVPEDKQDTFERSRNLFYVACSRPKKRLAVLFTQELSEPTMATLRKWFGKNNVLSLKCP